MSYKKIKGILLMIGAMVFLPVKDGMAKILGGTYSPLEIIWAQFCLVYILLAPFIILRYGARMLWPHPLGLQVLRSLFAVSGIGLFYWAVQYIPLASTTAIYFLAPLVVTALSPFVLDEPVDLRRWMAVIVGFLGVFLILRPDFNEFNKGLLIAFAGGVSIGLFYTCNRKLAAGTPAVVSLSYSVIIGAVLLSFAVPFVWVPPEISDIPMISGFILCALVGQGLLMASFKYAPASVVAPFQYSAIISATLFGFFMLGEFLDIWTFLGIFVVIGSGIYIAVREGQVNKLKSTHPNNNRDERRIVDAALPLIAPISPQPTAKKRNNLRQFYCFIFLLAFVGGGCTIHSLVNCGSMVGLPE
jgi:drug/metabolite transporter (DMT)-like permease